MRNILTKNENKIAEANFGSNVHIILSDKRLIIFKGNILGNSEISQPLKAITSVTISKSFLLPKFILGLMSLALSVSLIVFNYVGSRHTSSLAPIAVAMICLIFGTIICISSFKKRLIITNNARKNNICDANTLTESELYQFVKRINFTISEL